jgi:two-component system sensor histidine kinase TctE
MAISRSFGRTLAAIGLLRPGRSLHGQLLLWLLLPQIVLWLAGAWVSYLGAARYANQAIDANLSQATRALSRQVKPIGNGLFIDFPRAAQDIIESDPDDRVFYTVSTPPGQFILGNRTLPAPPGADPTRLGETQLYNATIDGVPMRVAAMFLAYGEDGSQRQTMLVQMARGRAARDKLARDILGDIVLPLSGLIALMTMIIWAGIRAGLAPLDRMRALVERRAPNDLAPLKLNAPPEELRSLLGALNSLLAAVQGNVATQQRFISDAAHQLRTPLAGLKSQTELALNQTSDPDLQARLHRVHDSATRSAHLVTQLLTLARAEPESAAALGRSRFDLRKLMHELTAEMVPRALKAGIDLGMDDSDVTPGDSAPLHGPHTASVAASGVPAASDTAHALGPLWVQGNALLLREAFSNVIDNALRYAGPGAEVTVRARAGEQGHAVVEVDDNGPGIPAELQPRVFERFFRVATTGNGCGLGLAIVKEIVERHEGQVTVGNLAPHGLRVRMGLPLAG